MTTSKDGTPRGGSLITAVSSGEAVIDGEPMRFIAGISRVAPGHPALRDARVARFFGITAAGPAEGGSRRWRTVDRGSSRRQ